MSDESGRFGRYLVGVRPSSYAREWYGKALAGFPERFAPRGRLDRSLLAMSRWPWLPLRCVDMAARILAPAAAVRRRLVLLTAILENAPDTRERYEIPGARSLPGFAAGLAVRGILCAAALLAGLVVAGLAVAVGAGGRTGS